MKNIPNVLFITLILITVGGLNACTPYYPSSSPWETQRGTQDNTIPPSASQQSAQGIQKVTNVAILLPLSGRNAALGQSMLQGAQMALFEINNPNLNLIPRDTMGTNVGAAQAAQSALQDGATLILGPVFADSVRAVKPVARQRNVNMIAFSTDQSLADSNTFLMGFIPSTQASDIAHYAAQNNLKNISIVTPRDAYGNIVTAAFENALRQKGGSINQTIRYVPNDPELSSNIAKMSPNVDAVFMPAGINETRAISDYLDQNNMSAQRVKRLGTGLWDNNQIARISTIHGGWFAGPSPKNHYYFKQKYKNLYNEDPVRIASLAFDATALSATLLQNARNKGSSIAFNKGAITDPNGFAGVDGVFRFQPNGMVERKLSILEIQNGQIDEIKPAQLRF